MKHKKLAILLLILVFVGIGIFSIYKTTYKETFRYVALGDSLAAGRNPYGVDDYGYTDYIRDYLKREKKLNDYINYAVSGYKTQDIINDINYNREIEVDNTRENIRKALRESDLVTISIGANDFLNGINISSLSIFLDDDQYGINNVDETIIKVDDLLVLVKKYAKNEIIVIGYYNPLPMLVQYKNQIDSLVSYADQEYQQLCDKHNIIYVKISDVIASNNSYLPNPLDIHPNKKGYEAISEEIINQILK